MKKMKILVLATALMSGAAYSASESITLYEAGPQGAGPTIGEVTVSETPYGLLFTPSLRGLPQGIHGFHVHENASCLPGVKEGKPVPALMAGGHWDPEKRGKHMGPYSDAGHLGDLPGLVVNADGTANYAVLAPRLKSLAQLKGHALMVHVGGDNYDDHPHALGGGGARMACGVIQ
ncbi:MULTISPECIES: superoxide dismutase family protein [Edwardsiella]|nr:MULTISPECIES: superoxide dismutase family protein [Edwardsiella]AKM46204.1 superoxide dismutase [Edwardsiella sp. EA181011]GAJ68892.1 superoxide dismutase, Cu-Zn [Edwardsiella piscicida]AKR76528.1 superoxide dismutase family protein [Edwardsiella sp. LADL05-105]KAB0588969.1 superoxide dismutase [Cu-Zn] SodC1 [Edwardsiella anguillarum]RFT04708.1 superoxide dismutase [Cu-Zn] SodC1 [Edwardsiella anguillarum]